MQALRLILSVFILTSCSQLPTFITERTDTNAESQELEVDSTTTLDIEEKLDLPQQKAINAEQKNKLTSTTVAEFETNAVEPSSEDSDSNSSVPKLEPDPLVEKSALDESNPVLDLPFDPIENEIKTRETDKKDFSEYGFITPDNNLETLLNDELKSLRSEKQSSEENDLLARIRSGFQLDLSLDNKRIRAERNWYLRNPNYLARTFNRASRYLYHIVNEVEERNYPLELALLPFVESAYNPFAYSHGRASGLWQFIPGTGKIYGLNQDWWYDGRRDVLASTEAAMNYLGYLSNTFDGNWLHALAAYNSGSGRVRSAIRRNETRRKGIDFWSLDLPKETRAYVPKLVALSQIVADPEKYGVEFPFIEDKPYFEKIDIGAQIDLAQAASLAQIDISEVYQLNPGFNQWATSPLGPHRLLVPVENAQLFRENLKTLPPEKRINWERYSVQRGDSLIKIAKKFNTSPMLIREMNHLKSNKIKIKQKLLIPTASKGTSFYDLSHDNRLSQKQAKIDAKKTTGKIDYRVKAGDTLWELAREHKVGVRELARWNGIAPTDPIRPEQTLIIWSNNQRLNEASVSPMYQKREMIQKVGYYVRKGDSLARIAQKFNVSIKDLVTWNNIDKRKYLKPGQKLTIYVDITNT